MQNSDSRNSLNHRNYTKDASLANNAPLPNNTTTLSVNNGPGMSSSSSSTSSSNNINNNTETRKRTGASEEAWNEAMALLSRGPAKRAPWNMDALKAAILFARPGTGQIKLIVDSCSFRPREPGFTSLINFCGRLTDWQKAVDIFEAMTSIEGIRPNKFTYSALISACSGSGEWEKAIEVFEEMKLAAKSDPGCKPNAVTYSALITACERSGHFEQALKIFDEMEDYDVKADQVTYTAAISSCLRSDRIELGEKLIYRMHEDGYVSPPNIYCDLFAKYRQDGNWQNALDLFLAIQMVGIEVLY